ncbi:MAG: phosphoribosylaminoimidazolesuccinocarboxamide synthase [Fimbriimonadaceae bacterium]|nr:phosphoribosylaminoimidazolesuccinocarboxamide synthase [Fimbriimonadaceae bacterium]
MTPVLDTRIPGLPEPRRGKVRDVYDLGDHLLLVASDRISAFDVVLPNGIPDKGRILTQMSTVWFKRFSEIPNHLVETEDSAIAAKLECWSPKLAGRSVIARKAVPLEIECVVRGHICGSLFKEYRTQGPNVHKLSLPEGLRDGDRLPEPIFTPATKAQTGHDENISFDRAAEIVGRDTAEEVRRLSLHIYKKAAELAEKSGLILADTKFEFGRTEDGIIWIDEALTPDSSRYWEAATWQPGGPQPSFDKQPVRDWLDGLDWDKTPPGPELPAEVVQATQARYAEAARRLCGLG